MPTSSGSNKVAVFVRLVAAPGKGGALVAALMPMFDVVGGEAGTEVYAMHTSADEPDVVRFYEVYADRDAQKSHGASETMAKVGGDVASLLAEAPEIVRCAIESAKGVAL